MPLTNLAMSRYNTTMMGVLKGVLDYFTLPTLDAYVFGVSGHAFLMNIHNRLCPSGPYCWNSSGMIAQISLLGVSMKDLGFYSSENSLEERHAVEAILREHLERGFPCSLLNMENQLITGFDETGFLTAQPWAPTVDFPPSHLTFGTWEEIGQEIHLNFFTFDKEEPAPELHAIRQSLRYAVLLADSAYLHPEGGDYASGLAAYDFWTGAIAEGDGNSHGNWWNGTVWSECRHMAGQYCGEIAGHYPAISPRAIELATRYTSIGSLLYRISDKALPKDDQIALLAEAKELESSCIPLLTELADQLIE